VLNSEKRALQQTLTMVQGLADHCWHRLKRRLPLPRPPRSSPRGTEALARIDR
jgi:hypothetical protein